MLTQHKITLDISKARSVEPIQIFGGASSHELKVYITDKGAKLNLSTYSDFSLVVETVGVLTTVKTADTSGEFVVFKLKGLPIDWRVCAVKFKNGGNVIETQKFQIHRQELQTIQIDESDIATFSQEELTSMRQLALRVSEEDLDKIEGLQNISSYTMDGKEVVPENTVLALHSAVTDVVKDGKSIVKDGVASFNEKKLSELIKGVSFRNKIGNNNAQYPTSFYMTANDSGTISMGFVANPTGTNSGIPVSDIESGEYGESFDDRGLRVLKRPFLTGFLVEKNGQNFLIRETSASSKISIISGSGVYVNPMSSSPDDPSNQITISLNPETIETSKIPTRTIDSTASQAGYLFVSKGVGIGAEWQSVEQAIGFNPETGTIDYNIIQDFDFSDFPTVATVSVDAMLPFIHELEEPVYTQVVITRFSAGITYYYKNGNDYIQVQNGEAFDSTKTYYIRENYSRSKITWENLMAEFNNKHRAEYIDTTITANSWDEQTHTAQLVVSADTLSAVNLTASQITNELDRHAIRVYPQNTSIYDFTNAGIYCSSVAKNNSDIVVTFKSQNVFIENNINITIEVRVG